MKKMNYKWGYPAMLLFLGLAAGLGLVLMEAGFVFWSVVTMAILMGLMFWSANYFGISLDGIDHSNCKLCDRRNSFLSKKLTWEFHPIEGMEGEISDHIFHCMDCHEKCEVKL